MKTLTFYFNNLKKLGLALLTTCFALSAYSQAPNGINYQAAVRNSSGSLVTNQNVDFKFTIKEGSTTIYSEEHLSVNTSAQGLVNLVIGEGTTLSGTFSDVNWKDGNQESMEIEVDLGSGYVTVGTQDFQSVPYALNNPWVISSAGDLSYIDTNVNSERIKIETTKDLTGVHDLMSLSIPFTSASSAQFIEFERGFIAVARINSDGSSEFQHVELTDTAGFTNAPTPGAMYADNAPMAWGYIDAGSSPSLRIDFGVASVTRNALGDYTVTLDNDWDVAPAIMVTLVNTGNDVLFSEVDLGLSTNSFDVSIREIDNSTFYRDADFMVIVFGRPQ